MTLRHTHSSFECSSCTSSSSKESRRPVLTAGALLILYDGLSPYCHATLRTLAAEKPQKSRHLHCTCSVSVCRCVGVSVPLLAPPTQLSSYDYISFGIFFLTPSGIIVFFLGLLFLTSSRYTKLVTIKSPLKEPAKEAQRKCQARHILRHTPPIHFVVC